MRTVNLLLGVTDRKLGNSIEALVLDACYNQAAVTTTWTVRADEFARQSCSPSFQLIIAVPDNLLPAPSRRGSRVSIEDIRDALRVARTRCGTPVIAFSASEEEDAILWEAGADSVLRLPLAREQLQSEVRRLLNIAELAVETEADAERRSSLAARFSRGWARLLSA